MSKPVTRGKKKLATWRSRRRIVARRRTARPRDSIDPRETSAHLALDAATQVRKAIQDRIVRAFRRHIEDAGSGPTEAELQMFARLAVAEQRLGHSLAQAKLQRYAGEHP